MHVLLGDQDARAGVAQAVQDLGDAPDDDLGVQRLRTAYAAAGWAEVRTALEPEAAGYRLTVELEVRAPAACPWNCLRGLECWPF